MAQSQISTLFSTAKLQLKILDNLIEGDADDDSSDFAGNYFIMRRTIDHKGGGGKKGDGKGNKEHAEYLIFIKALLFGGALIFGIILCTY